MSTTNTCAVHRAVHRAVHHFQEIYHWKLHRYHSACSITPKTDMLCIVTVWTCFVFSNKYETDRDPSQIFVGGAARELAAKADNQL